MPDPTPAEQVRAEAIERLAKRAHWQVEFMSLPGDPPEDFWEQAGEEIRQATREAVSGDVDAIADLLRPSDSQTPPKFGDPEAVADEFGIQGLAIEDGTATLTTMPTSEQARELVLAMSLACGRMLDDDQATNYVEFEVSPANRPGYVVHVRRAGGPTPHTLRKEAEARIETAARLIRAFVDTVSECQFDNHGDCQAHGFTSIEPGELCPNDEAQRWLAECAPEATDA
ncbi:hypothetical protein [Nocardia wallacei]|uniref:hypothetical protein n=1 Tax=Nocardia wallacei TaxID=480035 RepID=UPI00245491EC|nr:hypothetical protein [Nocardia wallacei]